MTDLAVFDHVTDDDIAPGALVKVMVESAQAESFWVQVTRKLADSGEWVGRVNNHLLCTDLHGLKVNDRLRFRACHVIRVDD